MLLRVAGSRSVVRRLLAIYSLSFAVVFEDEHSLVVDVSDAPWIATQGLNTTQCCAKLIPSISEHDAHLLDCLAVYEQSDRSEQTVAVSRHVMC